eukprot:5175742-Pleurochrysis_carterae.AAC.1
MPPRSVAHIINHFQDYPGSFFSLLGTLFSSLSVLVGAFVTLVCPKTAVLTCFPAFSRSFASARTLAITPSLLRTTSACVAQRGRPRYALRCKTSVARLASSNLVGVAFQLQTISSTQTAVFLIS